MTQPGLVGRITLVRADADSALRILDWCTGHVSVQGTAMEALPSFQAKLRRAIRKAPDLPDVTLSTVTRDEANASGAFFLAFTHPTAPSIPDDLVVSLFDTACALLSATLGRRGAPSLSEQEVEDRLKAGEGLAPGTIDARWVHRLKKRASSSINWEAELQRHSWQPLDQVVTSLLLAAKTLPE